jgi:hypothetical protein
MTGDLDQLIERYHGALSEFMTGNPQPAVAFFSRRDDITLANPFGPVARGPNQVKLAAEHAAINYRGGRAISFELFAKCVTHDLAYLVEVERYEATVGGRDDLTPLALRYQHLQPRDRWLEASASSRRSDHNRSASRISVAEVGSLGSARPDALHERDDTRGRYDAFLASS